MPQFPLPCHDVGQWSVIIASTPEFNLGSRCTMHMHAPCSAWPLHYTHTHALPPPPLRSSILATVGKRLSYLSRILKLVPHTGTHHLFAIFYVALILHPKPAIPNEYHEWLVSDTWVWVAGPILIYITERLVRGWRHYRWKVRLLEARRLPANILEVKLSKPRGFRSVAGQYVMIRCPRIALFEWHPFSLTSAPQEPFITVHVQAAGDWSSQLTRMFQAEAGMDGGRGVTITPRITDPQSSELEQKSNVGKLPEQQHLQQQPECHGMRSESPEDQFTGIRNTVATQQALQSRHVQQEREQPQSCWGGGADPAEQLHMQVIIDGPYGAPTQDHKHFRNLLLVGGGIGVTPMLSVLKSLLYERYHDEANPLSQPRGAYLDQSSTSDGTSPLPQPDWKPSGIHNILGSDAHRYEDRSETADILVTASDLEQGGAHARGHCIVYWSVRDEEQFLWATEILRSILARDHRGFLEVHVHVTGATSSFARDSLTGSKARHVGSDIILTRGRPAWEDVFHNIARDHPRTSVGVFFCGPKQMAKQLRVVSRRTTRATSTKFTFHQEHF